MLRKVCIIGLQTLAAAAAAQACDVCSIYAFLEAKEPTTGVYCSLFEQYTDFGTLSLDGREVDNPEGEYLKSSITQLIVGHQFGSRLGLQVNLPVIDRSFRRAVEGGIETGSESGVGDAALIAHWRVTERAWPRTSVVWSLLGGVKLPTGDSDRLAEELAEGHHDEEPLALAPTGRLTALHAGEQHDEEGEEHASGVHGHDLALGSGSTDGVLGTSLFISRGRFFTTASLQYALRTEGDFGYRYANDLTWSVAPGWFVWLAHGSALSVGAHLFGEDKGTDDLDGEALDDTAITALYAGPSVSYSRTGRVHVEARYDVPVEQDNSALQIVPDGRFRIGLTTRF